MIRPRKSEDRGFFDHGWLKAYHTFSFGEYRDTRHVRFRSLRVINEDLISPNMGFPLHPHEDMEIITYVVSGELEHRDSLGSNERIKEGDFQFISAGSGIEHSEVNPSLTANAHIVQIWIMPSETGTVPNYAMRRLLDKDKSEGLHLVASPDGREGSFKVLQDAELYSCNLLPETNFTYTLREGRGLWVQILSGKVSINNRIFSPGDGAAIFDESQINFCGITDSHLLLFDLK